MRMAGLFLALAIGLAVIAGMAAHAHRWVVAVTAGVLALWLGEPRGAGSETSLRIVAEVLLEWLDGTRFD